MMRLRRRVAAAGLATAALVGGLGATSLGMASTASAATMVEYGTHAPAGSAWNGKHALAATMVEYGVHAPGVTAIEY
jgi:hypothetical protein